MRISLALLAITLFFTTNPAGAVTAPTIDSVLAKFIDTQNQVLAAAAAYQAGHQPDAAAALNQAIAILSTIPLDITDPDLQALLGRKFNALGKKLDTAERLLQKAKVVVDANDPRMKPKAVINTIKVASKGVLSAGLLLGHPLLAEVSPATAGFHTPGQLVRFQVDPSGCMDTPTVMVQNAGTSPSVDLSSVALDPVTGILSLRMGLAPGGARVQVTACGHTVTRLLYNYGTPPVPGLPDGFPQYLTKGNYTMTYGGSAESRCPNPMGGDFVVTTPIPTTPVGTFPLVNVKTFANAVVQAFDTAVAAATQPGCSQSVSYSPATDTGFSVTYTVQCTSGQCTATSTITFTLQKQ